MAIIIPGYTADFSLATIARQLMLDDIDAVNAAQRGLDD